MTRICGHTKFQEANASRPQWRNRKKLTWAVDERNIEHFPIDYKSILEVCGEAFWRWEQVGGLWFDHHDSPTADLILQFWHPEAEPGNMLADFMIPQGDNRALLGRFDPKEAWRVFNNWDPDHIDLTRTACHEFGHGCGHLHQRQGIGALMEGLYGRITHPTEIDGYEQEVRYGPARARPETGGGDTGDPGPGPTLEQQSIVLTPSLFGCEIYADGDVLKCRKIAKD